MNEFVDRRRYMDTLPVVMDKFPYLTVGVSRTGFDIADLDIKLGPDELLGVWG
jgi:hypothetical protein